MVEQNNIDRPLQCFLERPNEAEQRYTFRLFKQRHVHVRLGGKGGAVRHRTEYDNLAAREQLSESGPQPVARLLPE